MNKEALASYLKMTNVYRLSHIKPIPKFKEWIKHFDIMKDKATRGGARPGAGRKRVTDPRKNMTVSVSPATYKRAIVLRNQGIKVNKLVEEAIEQKFMDITLPYSD